MARETGLEPATSGVTGRRSNQLSYSPTIFPLILPGKPWEIPENHKTAMTEWRPAG